MFDSYRIDSGPQYVSVTEKKAPTDESIRLAKEFQEKAREDLINSYVFDNPNEISGIVLVYREAFDFKSVVKVRAKINGRDHRFDLSISGEVDKETALDILADTVRKEYVRFVSLEFLKETK